MTGAPQKNSRAPLGGPADSTPKNGVRKAKSPIVVHMINITY